MDAYTLEVTPEEAERLVLAEAKGGLRFALRNVTDTETVLTTGATLRETLAYYRPIEPTDRSKAEPVPRARRARALPKKGYTIEVIKGLKRTIDEF